MLLEVLAPDNQLLENSSFLIILGVLELMMYHCVYW